MRQARQVNDYNFRSYAVRRVKTGFYMNRDLQGDEAAAALTEAQEQLEVLRRQVIVGNLYPSARSVME